MKKQKYNILVTGASGFVGTNLVKKLIKQNHKIIGTFHNKEPKLKLSKIVYKKADLRVLNNCLKITKGIDYVFMCAANSSGAKVIQENPLAHF